MPYGTYPSYPANTDPDLVQYLEALKRAIADVAVTGTLVVRKNSGADVGTRPRLNFIEGSNVTLTVADDAGSDEVDVTGLSGVLADPQTPASHSSTHENGGADEVDVDPRTAWRARASVQRMIEIGQPGGGE